MRDWHKRAGQALTRREGEVLALLAQGYSAPEIAEHLTLALSTVKGHVDHIYGKLGVNSKRQALNRARELGLIAPAPMPASPTPADLQHNLPSHVTRFIGREAEIAQLRERLGEHRCVTLAGPGGVGKTRLALHAAEGLLAAYANGVWFVELAALAEAGLVPPQIAGALGLRDEPGRPALETLTVHLRRRQILLVIDNCEHVLDGCAEVADTLLRACPQLTLLATSREPLNVAGEAVFPVPPLPFPEHGLPVSAASLEAYAAVGLFRDRAKLVLPDFAIGPHNAGFVAAICQRLDGIPLALELAAACMHTLSAEQLAGRLDSAFSVLTNGRRTALPRHQTLRAAIDWSYQRLSERERLLLQRLSVFAGGCTLEAAEAVCAGEGLEAGEVLEVLRSLVGKSLVVADRQPGQNTRFRLLEMVRQYAAGELEASGESHRLRTGHRDFFTQLVVNDILPSGAEDPSNPSSRVRDEQQNLRHALEWSFHDEADIEAGPRLVWLLSGYWPRHAEWCDWTARAIQWCRRRAAIEPITYVRMLRKGAIYISLNDPQTAVTWMKQAAEIGRGLGPAGATSLLHVLHLIGWFYLGNAYQLEAVTVEEIRAAFDEADAILDRLGQEMFAPLEYDLYRAWFAADRVQLLLAQGSYTEAKRLGEATCRLFEVDGLRRTFQHADALLNLGRACLALGESEAARQHFRKAIQVADDVELDNGPNRKAFGLRWLGQAEYLAGNLAAAMAYCQESCRLARLVPDYNIIASCLGVSALILAQQGQPIGAARLSGASQAMYARQKRRPWEDAALDTLLPGWQEWPEAAEIARAFEAGQAMSSEEAVGLCLEASLEP